MAQSGPGIIEIFEDFFGEEDRLTGTQSIYKRSVGPFRVYGCGSEDASTGGVPLDEGTCPLSGVATVTASTTASDITGLTTTKMFDVALMGTLVMEARVQFAGLDEKSFFMGFSDENDEDEVAVLTSSATTVTYAASDLVGFHWDHSMTGVSEDDWHGVYRGGSAADETDSANLDLDATITAGLWDVLRVEVDNNGTARWYVNGVLEKILAGAVSTTDNLAAQLYVESHSTTAGVVYVDYILIRANRDWTI